MQITLVCGVILLWIVLAVGATTLILGRRPNRFLFAGAIGLVTLIIIIIAELVGLYIFEEPTWLAPLLGGVIFFSLTLLWTFLGPLLTGTTWSAMIKDAQDKGQKIKESAAPRK